jgi:hypothetical protein
MAHYSNSLYPFKDFLALFDGLTVDAYFQLNVIPYPVVTHSGRVIYRRDSGSFRTYDMGSSEPTDSDTTAYEVDDVFNRAFIDLAVFKNSVFRNDSTDIKFRLREVNVDNSRTSTDGNDNITTETRGSSTTLKFDPNTGLRQRDFHLYTDAYKFNNLDIINDVHDDYARIENKEKFNFVYDRANKTISISPKSTRSSKAQQKGKTMSTAANTTQNVLDQNKAALITATKLEVGGIAIDLVTQQVLKALPAPVQLLIGDNPAAKIAVANLVNLIIGQLNIDDPRVAVVNEAMMTVAYMETLKTFNFKQMIDTALAGIPADKLAILQKAE